MPGRLQLTAIADAYGIVMRNSGDRRDRRSKVRRFAAVLELEISDGGGAHKQREPRVNCAASRKHTGKFMPLLDDVSDNAMTEDAENAREEYLRLYVREKNLAIIESRTREAHRGFFAEKMRQ